MEELWTIDYGKIGRKTTAFGDKSTMQEPKFKIEWTYMPFGIIIDEAKVTFPNLTRGGIGTKAWNLFEQEHKGSTDRFLLVAGYRDWSGIANKLACNFWLKMGFTFIKNKSENKSGKCSGKPQRMEKKVGGN